MVDMNIYIKFVLAAIVVEAITNILTKSELFKPVRAFFFKKNKWLHDLLDCGYCTSVWIGFGLAIYITYLECDIVNVFMLGLVLHRVSNVVHSLVDWLNELRGQGKN
jgi:hypothetical protein